MYVNSSDNGQQGFAGRFTALDAAAGLHQILIRGQFEGLRGGSGALSPGSS
jgi:hypothetical protein